MISDAVKVAKINAKAVREAKQLDLVKVLATNPVIELIAGIAAITYLNKGSQSWLESISGIDLAAGSEYAGLIAVIGLQQIAPLIPSIVQAGGEVGKALPAVLALGMGA